jgi:ribosome-associated protein
MSDAEETVRALASAALDKRAEALVVLDLQGLSTVADYFLVCTARSATQLDTIADAMHATLKARGVRLRHREGTAASGWLLLDAGDVVAHLFLAETRAFYALERLWGDAPALSLDASPLPGGASGAGTGPSD